MKKKERKGTIAPNHGKVPSELIVEKKKKRINCRSMVSKDLVNAIS